MATFDQERTDAGIADDQAEAGHDIVEDIQTALAAHNVSTGADVSTALSLVRRVKAAFNSADLNLDLLQSELTNLEGTSGLVTVSQIDARPTVHAPASVTGGDIAVTVPLSGAGATLFAPTITEGLSGVLYANADGGSLLQGFEVNLGSQISFVLGDITTSKTVERVAWYIGSVSAGTLYRDDDTSAPYTMTYSNAAVSVGGTFNGVDGSGTGHTDASGNSFTFAVGTETIIARVIHTDASSFDVSATFTVNSAPTGGGGGSGGGPLAFSPPAGWESYQTRTVTGPGTVSLSSGQDYRIVMPNTINGTVSLSGGRNIVIIGGHINISSDAGFDNGNMGIRIRDCSGHVFIEGVLMEGAFFTEGIQGGSDTGIGSRIWTIQNCHMGRMIGSKDGNHADFVQPWDGADSIQIDSCTFGGTSTAEGSSYQGLMLKTDFNHAPGGIDWDVRRLNMYGHNDSTSSDSDLYGGGRYLIWNTGNIGDVSYQDTWVTPNPQHNGGTVDGTVYNANGADGSRIFDPDVGAYYTIPTSNNPTSSRVYEGTPPGGDWCPPSVPGTGYSSPGYQ